MSNLLNLVESGAVGESSFLERCKALGAQFDNLKLEYKLVVLLVTIGLFFVLWQLSLQQALNNKAANHNWQLQSLRDSYAALKEQVTRFEQLRAENKLLSMSEYRGQIKDRTTVSVNLGQWGEQWGLHLESSSQEGDYLNLKFNGNYPATLKFFEQLASEANALIMFDSLEYQVHDGQPMAAISLRIVLGNR